MNNWPKLGVQHLRSYINQPDILVNNVILLFRHQNIHLSLPSIPSLTRRQAYQVQARQVPPECRSKTYLCIWNRKYTVLIQTLPSKEQTCHLLNLLLPFVPAKYLYSTLPSPLSKNHKNCTVMLVPPASAAFRHTYFKSSSITSLLN